MLCKKCNQEIKDGEWAVKFLDGWNHIKCLSEDVAKVLFSEHDIKLVKVVENA